jgi:branched-chain amino acid transport system permease protein
MIEGVFRSIYGVSGLPYRCRAAAGRHQPGLHDPAQLPRLGGGGLARGVLRHLVRDREDPLGAYLRAGTENPKLVEAFGINVPLMVTLTYGFGVALAAFAGVLAAPVSRSRR